ncbi:MAG: NADH-quinone oxidoreductase subunit L [Planctomycetes bacterium]|nr:NADH-quinone oxidoreductase subunit L [Planctomycetota bacterium]
MDFLIDIIDTCVKWIPGWIVNPSHIRAFYAESLFIIPLMPLLGFLINGFFRDKISRGASGLVASLAAFASFLWAVLCFHACRGHLPEFDHGAGYLHRMLSTEPLHKVYGTWFDTGTFSCAFGLYMDQLSGVMALVVTGVGTLIHVYSMGYMAHDKAFARYFAYLNLFLFSMLVLILADNLVLTFVGWEGVGLCSYLLIGFWYEDGEKAAAGMKAFIFNRVGDLGFLLGIFTLVAAFGTANYYAAPHALGSYTLPVVAPHKSFVKDSSKEEGKREVVMMPDAPGLIDYADGLKLMGNADAKVPLGYKADGGNFDLSKTAGAKVFPAGWTVGFAISLACLLLFIGACGKSAQLPLYAWLPDAMAGPTPVSALIHAATMVTAGVYMLARLHALYLFSSATMDVVAIVGGTTAIFAALIGLTQTDIKKVLAYSTVSQLGYMFLGAGVGAFALAIFHVVTHALFKALLFLGSGSVIHAMSGEQDMRKMGGLRKKLPITFWTMVIGALALGGIVPFAGYWSKDAILANVLAKAMETHETSYWVLYLFACVGAFCTAFYTARLIGLTFFGECRASDEVKAHIHESPPSMTVPLIVLAVLSVIGGWWLHNDLISFLNFGEISQNAENEHVEWINLICTLAASFGGAGLGILLYISKVFVPKPEESKNPLVRLSFNKFYIEAFYDRGVTGFFSIFAEALHLFVDVLLIDFLLVNGVGKLVRGLGGALRKTQTGLINVYATGILVGALAILFYLLKG